MLTLVIPRTAESTVVHLTQENLQRELKSINGSELLVCDTWGEGIAKARNDFICLVEPDCLVSGGYFASQMGLFKKNPNYRQLGVMGSSTGINTWAKRIYGYKLGEKYSDGVLPVYDKLSTAPYTVPITYIPGAIMRMSTLKRVLKSIEPSEKDLIRYSTELSLEFWRLRAHVLLNPNSTYVTTEIYVGEQGKFDPKAGDLAEFLSFDNLDLSIT